MRKIGYFFIFSLLFLTSCAKQAVIVNDIPEREANEIVVFLASKGIPAVKMQSAVGAGPGAAAAAETHWSIAVNEKQEVDAMAILNRYGLPRKKAVTLLSLFAKSGLVSSEREENIRFQAGLAAQIAGTIRKIDGVIDADVELSIPEQEAQIPGAEAQREKITASVFVKHQGIIDDPNSHLVTKIKRLVAGSVAGLSINDVTVISDRSRFTDVMVGEQAEEITPKAKEYVSIWSIVLSKGSTGRFRLLFFSIIFAMVIFALLACWILWKFYPILRKKGWKSLLSPIPIRQQEEKEEEKNEGT